MNGPIVWKVFREYLNEELLKTREDQGMRCDLVDFSLSALEEGNGFLFFLKYPEAVLFEKIKNSKNADSDVIIVVDGNITCKEKVHYARDDIYVMNRSEFIKSSVFYGSVAHDSEQVFSFIDRKMNTMLEYLRMNECPEEIIPTFLSLTFDYEILLASATGSIMKQFIDNMKLDNQMCLIFLKEDGKLKIYGNEGDLIIKKEYEGATLPATEGLSVMEDCDFYMCDMNAFERAPEYKFVCRAQKGDLEATYVQYFNSLPYLGRGRQKAIRTCVEFYLDFLKEFGFTGFSGSTSENRLFKTIDLYEKKTGVKDHSRNTAKIAAGICGKLSLDNTISGTIEKAARLHDIGKLLLKRPSNGDDHDELGALILLHSRKYAEIIDIVLNHHAKRNKKLPEQIVFLADYLEHTTREKKEWDRKFLIEQGINEKLLSQDIFELSMLVEGYLYV